MPPSPVAGRAAARPPRFLPRLALVAAIWAAASPIAAEANNYGESASWQFESPQDIAAQAAARDLIERRRGGVFAAPVYNTNIARQYNCSISASAIGNEGMQSALANSPTTTGATSSATGNNSASTVTGDGPGGTIGTGQSNGGAVTSTLNGATTTHVQGTAWQSLSSSQSNSGDQSASVSNANACSFGVLN